MTADLPPQLAEIEARTSAVHDLGWSDSTSKLVRQLTADLRTLLAAYRSKSEEVETLTPAESMALTIALAQVRRGDEVWPNTTATLVFALERISRGTLPCEVCGKPATAAESVEGIYDDSETGRVCLDCAQSLPDQGPDPNNENEKEPTP